MLSLDLGLSTELPSNFSRLRRTHRRPDLGNNKLGRSGRTALTGLSMPCLDAAVAARKANIRVATHWRA